jgi:predicted CXXCH cytochrome family protein
MMRKIIHLTILAVLVGLMVTNRQAAAQAPPATSRSAKACALCHFRWIETFFVQGRGTDLIEYQADKVVATPDMCFSCHDGSIMDSRAKMVQGKNHRTGSPPPPGVDIPNLFPMDDSGNLYCGTCHTAHGVPSSAGEQTTIFMRTDNRNSAMCRMCHPGKNGGPPSNNHPLGAVARDVPKTMRNLSSAALQKPNWISCESCHAAHGAPFEAYLVENFRNSNLCLGCHPDKSTFTPQGAKKPGHVVNVRPVSASIPDNMLKNGARLGSDGEIICSTCHKTHENSTGHRRLLLVDARNTSFCLTCHTDKNVVVETGHNLERSAPKVKNLQGQTVEEAGACSACHLPHQPARRISGDDDFTTQLCMSCHGRNAFAARKKLFGGSHPLGVSPFGVSEPDSLYTPVRVAPDQLSLPLYDDSGVRSVDGLLTCATCHDPHRRQTVSAADSEGSKNRFLRKPPEMICNECHADKFAVAESKHNLIKAAPAVTNLLGHKAADAGLCGSCHLVHGGDQLFMWARQVPKTESAQAQALCFSCHLKDGPASEKLIHEHSHPLGIAPGEQGLSTRLPLFDSESRMSADGRMTCYTCHDPHRWQPRNVSGEVRTDVEGDGRTSFLRLTNSPSPALCGDCHKLQARIEKTDHDLQLSAPRSKNAHDQTPSESGACGACHLAHNSENPFLMWARSFDAGNDIMEGLCRSCHAKGGAAEGKIPAIATHPRNMTFSNSDRNAADNSDYFPLYESATGQEVRHGKISCPSCHDGHQWRPTDTTGGGDDPEGNASNSFLRNASFDTLCSDCHGIEALYRYLYFHHPVNRIPESYQNSGFAAPQPVRSYEP